MAQSPYGPPPKKGMSTFTSVLLALIVFFIVIPLGSCVACAVCAGVKKGMDDSKVHTSVSTATAAASEPPSPVPAPTPGTVTVAFASFPNPKDSILNKCFEATITLPPGADGATVANNFAAHFMDGAPWWTQLNKSCAQQFRTNPVLATCTMSQVEDVVKGQKAVWFGDAGAPVPFGAYQLQLSTRFYNLDTLTANDQYMKDCLDNKGDWQMVDKDSDAYREAARARARRNIEKGLKALGQ